MTALHYKFYFSPVDDTGDRSVVESGSTLHDRLHSSVVVHARGILRMEAEGRQQVVSSRWSRCAATLEPRKSDRGPGTEEEEGSIDHQHDSSDCSYRRVGIPRGDPFCQTEEK